jgi:hypothetical protein
MASNKPLSSSDLTVSMTQVYRYDLCESSNLSPDSIGEDKANGQRLQPAEG